MKKTNRKPGLVPDDRIWKAFPVGETKQSEEDANILEDAYDRLIFDLAGGDDNDRFSDYNEHLAHQITRDFNFYPDVIYC